MSCDHWKTTEPEPQDGLRQCDYCGGLTDCLYPMAKHADGRYYELEGPLTPAEEKAAEFCCYKCCDQLEEIE